MTYGRAAAGGRAPLGAPRADGRAPAGRHRGEKALGQRSGRGLGSQAREENAYPSPPPTPVSTSVVWTVSVPSTYVKETVPTAPGFVAGAAA